MKLNQRLNQPQRLVTSTTSHQKKSPTIVSDFLITSVMVILHADVTYSYFHQK